MIYFFSLHIIFLFSISAASLPQISELDETPEKKILLKPPLFPFPHPVMKKGSSLWTKFGSSLSRIVPLDYDYEEVQEEQDAPPPLRLCVKSLSNLMAEFTKMQENDLKETQNLRERLHLGIIKSYLNPIKNPTVLEYTLKDIAKRSTQKDKAEIAWGWMIISHIQNPHILQMAIEDMARLGIEISADDKRQIAWAWSTIDQIENPKYQKLAMRDIQTLPPITKTTPVNSPRDDRIQIATTWREVSALKSDDILSRVLSEIKHSQTPTEKLHAAHYCTAIESSEAEAQPIYKMISEKSWSPTDKNEMIKIIKATINPENKNLLQNAILQSPTAQHLDRAIREVLNSFEF